MTAHVYVRVSTVKQKHSSQRQTDACIAYAQRLGHADVKVYCDLAVSGAKPISKRKGLQALVANLKHGDVVIYESRDRLARNVAVANEFDSVCDALKVTQYSMFEDGHLASHDIGAQDMREAMRKRTSDTLRQMQITGRYTGGPVPYGYRLGADGGRLEVDPAEQAALSAIRELRAAGLSLRKVAAALEARGMLARSGRRWSAGLLLNALNPMRYGRASVAAVTAAEEAMALIRGLRAGGMSLRGIADELNARGVACRGERWHQISFDFGGAS